MIDPIPPLTDGYQRPDFNEFLRRYLMGDTTCVCEWEPGLGKTLLAIALARALRHPRMLVTCPQIGLVSWEKELEKWWPSASRLIVGSGKDIRKLRPHHAVVVVTHDLPARSPEVRERLRDWATDAFGVIDEAQYLRGPATARTGASYGRGEGIFTHAARMFLMSGSLIVSWPVDLWTHLARWFPERITYEGRRMSFIDFRERFFETRQVSIPGTYQRRTKILGFKPAMDAEYRERVSGWALRRTKAEADLPPLTWRDLPLPLGDKDRRRIDSELMNNLPPKLQTLYAAAQKAGFDSPESARFADELASYTEQWGVVQRIMGVGKAHALAAVIKDRLANTPDTHAIGIFSLNHAVMDVFDKALAPFGVLRIDGSTSHARRTEVVDQFQQERGPRVFNGQIVACGTALTLTRSNIAYFPQLSAIPGDNFQAASRFHRIGQHNPVTAWLPSVPNTIDQPLRAMLRKKIKTANAVYQE